MNNSNSTFGILSLVFAILALLIFPPFFGLLGVIFGIIGIAKKEGNLAIIGLVLSIILSIAGMIIGDLMWNALIER